MKATEEKSRIQIRNPVVLIRGSESVSKCHGSKTLGEMNCGKQQRDITAGTGTRKAVFCTLGKFFFYIDNRKQN
jgi:hypothetical protein